MGQTELKIFVILATLILLVFIGGIIVFIFQYHKRKLMYEREKAAINQQHVEELLSARLEIQQQTMQDIGREIHDNVGQRLTLASLYTNKLVYDKQFPEISERISAIATIINESLDELRSLSKSLTSPDVEEAELKVLIENECNRLNGLNLCQAICTFSGGQPRISTTRKYFILRIVQEFIQNSLKHSGCTRITLDFSSNASGVTLKVEDNGVGFDCDTPRAGNDKGIGLMNMKKRAELMGAVFSFSSAINKGTFMSIFIPAEKLNQN